MNDRSVTVSNHAELTDHIIGSIPQIPLTLPSYPEPVLWVKLLGYEFKEIRRWPCPGSIGGTQYRICFAVSIEMLYGFYQKHKKFDSTEISLAWVSAAHKNRILSDADRLVLKVDFT
jgi:hypothetical protein